MTQRYAAAGRALVLSVALLAFTSSGGRAQSVGPDLPGIQVSVGPQVSTLGIGAGASVRFARMFGASVEYHFTPAFPDIEESGTNNRLTADVSVHGGTLMATWHPTGGSFAVGAGLFFGGANADITLDLDPNGTTTVDLGDHSYDAADVGTVSGEIDYSGVRPVFALGLMGTGLNVVLGAAIVGPDASLSADGALSTDPEFRRDLDLEIEDLNDDLSKVPVYPYVRIGWRFGVL